MTPALVAGYASMQLQVIGTIPSTNIIGQGTVATNPANSLTNTLSAYVLNGDTYVFTNKSSGTGDTAGLVTGSGLIMVH